VSNAWTAGLRGHKASVYEGGVRVPCFARWPGHFPAGAKVQAMTSHLDILPTLCDLAGVPLPAGRPLDGRSLRNLLTDGRGSSPHEFLCHTWNRYTPSAETNGAICTERYKLVVPQAAKKPGTKPGKKEPGPELYDLAADPGEKTNLAEQHPDVAAELQAKYRRWFQEVTAGQTYRPVPIPVGQADENPVEIQASWAQLPGASPEYVFRAYDWDTLQSWARPGDAATWELDVKRAGHYEVTLSYGCPPLDCGGRLRISVGPSAVEFQPQATVTGEVFTTARAGVLELPAGRATLTAQAVRIDGHDLLRWNRIWLKRIEP
jgi:hypothetical protein